MLNDPLFRLRALFRRELVESELDEEMRFHFDGQVQKLVESGLSPEQARRRARLTIGGSDQIKEQCREARGLHFLEVTGQDIRYGLRVLRKSPVFTTVAVLTLALGIGANTAIFSVINAVLLKNLPVEDPQQLVFLTNPDEQGFESGFADGNRDLITYPEFQQLAQNDQVFSGMFASASEYLSLSVGIDSTEAAGEGAPVHIGLVSGSYFSVLGVSPILGRAFGPEVDRVRDANPVAVVSYGFWRDRLGKDASALGRKVRIRQTSYQIIGVAPPEFHGETVGVSTDLWVPLSMQSELFPGRDFLSVEPKPFHKIEWLQAMGRLKPGVSLAQAKASMNVAFQQILQAQTGQMSQDDRRKFLNQHLAVVEGSRGASTLRDTFSKPLQVLMAVVGLILLIACANVANILLARSAARQKEIAVRAAVGAGAQRLFRQVMTESILLAAIGGAVGLLLAHWADAALLRLVSGGPTPVPLDVHPDPKVLAFTFGVSVFTGILFGLAPALRATHVDLSATLKGTSRALSGGGSQPGRMPAAKVLVVAQVALSLLLLVVAGLFVRTLDNLSHVQFGYDRDHLLIFSMNPLSAGYKSAEIPQLYRNILDRLRAIPGIQSASLMDNGLLGGTDSNSPISIEGGKPSSGGGDDDSHWDMVGPNFFSTTGIPILYGREIGPQDGGNGQRVGLLNQTAARHFFGNQNPIGSRILVHTTSGKQDFVVVGVVADSKHRSPREKPQRRFYIPFFNPIGEATYASFLVRTAGDPSTAASAVRDAVKHTVNVPPVEIETMNQRMAESLTSDRMITRLAAAFGVLAMILVCIGLYGIMSYAVSSRTSEIGIRMALGARKSSVLWLILRESSLLVLIGAAIGLPAIFAAGKWISSLLFGVKPADPVTLASATAMILAAGLVACYIPARRAMSVEPVVALRYE